MGPSRSTSSMPVPIYSRILAFNLKTLILKWLRIIFGGCFAFKYNGALGLAAEATVNVFVTVRGARASKNGLNYDWDIDITGRMSSSVKNGI